MASTMPKPGAHGALGIIFMRLGIAKIDEQAIAEILRDMPLEALRSPWHRCPGRLGRPRAALRDQAGLASAVESTRSQNRTVSWRRSASGGRGRADWPPALTGSARQTRRGRWAGETAGVASVSPSPDQDCARPHRLRCGWRLEKFVLSERFQVRIIEGELALEHAIGHAAPLAQEGQSLGPRPRQSPPRVLPAWRCACVRVRDSIIA